MSAESSKASKAVKRRDPLKKHRILTVVDPEAVQARRETIANVLADVDVLLADETVLPVVKELAEPILAMVCSYVQPLARGEEKKTLIDLGSALMFRFVDRHMSAMTAAVTLPRAKRPSKKRKKR
jgi:hypothetical protein